MDNSEQRRQGGRGRGFCIVASGLGKDASERTVLGRPATMEPGPACPSGESVNPKPSSWGQLCPGAGVGRVLTKPLGMHFRSQSPGIWV